MSNAHGLGPPLASRLGLAGAAAAVLLLTYLLAVWTPLGQSVDTRAMAAISDAVVDDDWAESWLWFVSPVVVMSLSAGVVSVAALARSWAAAATTGAIVVTTVLSAQLLKGLLVRPAIIDGAANSLPSGHVAAVAGIAVAAAVAVPPGQRAAAVVAGAAAVVLTGLATLALEWHRPSDVVASVVLALGVGCATTAWPWGGQARPERAGDNGR